MYKKTSVPMFLVILFLLLAVCSACEKSESLNTETTDKSTEYSFDEHLRDVELPADFSIALSDDAVYSPAVVNTYKGEHIALDREAVTAQLTELYGEDISFRVKSSSYSAYVFRQNFMLRSYLSNIARMMPGVNTLTENFGGSMNNNDYAFFGDLDFMPVDDCISIVDKLLVSFGFGDTELLEAYALDWETMAEHDAIYVDILNSFNSKDTVSMYPWSKNDECYILIYTSQLDGIPFYTNRLTLKDNPMGQTYVVVSYCAEGLIDMTGRNTFSNFELVSEDAALSSIDALGLFLDNMRKVIHTAGTKLTSMELCYLPLSSEDDTTVITPVWTFEVTGQAADSEGGVDGYRTTVDQYIYNAITGEVIYSR